jgi:hypothetical protein
MISITAHVGREARAAVNSKRSITGTRRVSDSFLKPAISKGKLRRVTEVDTIGDVYVRIAGREELARVSFEEFKIDKETMKLPINKPRKYAILQTDC